LNNESPASQETCPQKPENSQPPSYYCCITHHKVAVTDRKKEIKTRVLEPQMGPGLGEEENNGFMLDKFNLTFTTTYLLMVIIALIL
jgi:hypothetical protein